MYLEDIIRECRKRGIPTAKRQRYHLELDLIQALAEERMKGAETAEVDEQ